MVSARRIALALLLGLCSATAGFADGQAKVSIQADNRDIREVILTLAKAANVKVRLQPEVRGLVSTDIKATPFEQALTVVAAAQGYRWRLVDGVYHIGRFSEADDNPQAVTERIALRRYDARALARAFGYLDLESLDQPTTLPDLRQLLPPGLDGPPRPIVADNCLKASGRVSAVADLRYLIARLEGGAAIRYDVILAWITPELLEEASQYLVYWTKGQVDYGRSPGRVVWYSAADLSKLLAKLRERPEGLTILADESIDSYDLATAAIEVGKPDEDSHATLRLAARVEAGLGLRLWLKGAVRLGEETIAIAIDDAPLPPEEGIGLVSLPKHGEEGPGPLILVLMPTVMVAEGNG